eukprot:XP_002520480.2 LOW QUALITY PROTEIN: uncharacterized protein LOC8279820 [Ricinus communis]
MAEEVKLIGNWASPFTRRVELALKIKGVKYEYIEEDLANKSDLLLKYNPIHKKVPVLVHNGKSICESLVIIEYIDETWKHHHHILPKEPYHRAVARFWARFVDEKLLPTTFKIECAIKEEKDKIIHEVHEHLKLLEHELKHKEHEFFGGLELGYLDIVTFFIGHWVQVHQEVMEIDLITEEKYPFFCKWMVKLHKIDIVHGCLPPKEKHIAFFKAHFGAVKFTSKKVKLLGTWLSSFSHRIEVALKLKGMQYVNMEEDLSSKGPLLLNSNPVYKNIPVCLYQWKPIAESIVILNYIDRTWKNYSFILAKDPYDRAIAHFWAKFVDEKIMHTAYKAGIAKGEELEKLHQEIYQNLSLLENELKGKEFFGGEKIGYLDIAAFMITYWFQVYCQGLLQTEFITEQKFPALHKWIAKLSEIEVVRECLPPKDKHVSYLKARFEARKSPSK